MVRTFVDSRGTDAARDSTKTVHVDSGIDPAAGGEPETVERIFPVAQSG